MKYYKLHLIRHGLTQGNLDGRYIGSGTDLPLCAEGRAQLEELKAKFQYPDVPLVFCSPMLRAQQTAEVLFPNAKLTILQDLREICPAFDEDIYEAISMDTCVNKRLTIGAPGKEAMEKVIAIYRNDLSESDEL